MAANIRYNSMHNRAKLMVMKKYYPDLVKGMVEFIHSSKMDGKENDGFAYEVGRHAICGSTISDFLKEQEMLGTVNNIVYELAYSKKNIDETRSVYPNIDNQIQKNKSFAKQLLLENFVKSHTDPRLTAAVNKNGSVAKRLMMKIGGALNIGKDCRRDATFSEILRGMSHETFARRNRNGDARTMGAGNLDAANSLTEDVMRVAHEKGFTLANDLTRKFEEIKANVVRKAKTAAAVSGVMAVAVLSSTATTPENTINIDKFMENPSFHQAVDEGLLSSQKTISLEEFHRLEMAYAGGFETDSNNDIDVYESIKEAESLQYSSSSSLQEQLDHEVFEAQYQSMYQSIDAGHVVVFEGDNLTEISERVLTEVYGDYLSALTESEYQQQIHKVNMELSKASGLDNPDLIYPDQKISIPEQYKELMSLGLEERVDLLAESLSQKNTSSVKFNI